jgi:hypothetical protein
MCGFDWWLGTKVSMVYFHGEDTRHIKELKEYIKIDIC